MIEDITAEASSLISQNLQNNQALSRWSQVKEALLTLLVGGIPQPFGIRFRRYLYRLIFARQGKTCSVYKDVDIIGGKSIEIGDNVKINRGTCLNGKACNSKICLGNGTVLERGVYIKVTGSGNCHIEIGENARVGAYTCMADPGHIKIGQSCLISSHVGIYANQHTFANSNQETRQQGFTAEGIVIENDCWLGTGVKVMHGVTIGRGSVVGAGAVVTKDLPPYSVAVGVPVKVISRLLDEKKVT